MCLHLKKLIERSRVCHKPQLTHRHQEEEKKDKNIHVQNKQMYKKHKDQLPLLQARWSEC